MKKYLSLSLLLFLLFNCSFAFVMAEVSNNLNGYILVQVQKNGEAWYVNPFDSKRHYMGRPDDAFKLMRLLGVGISNNDLDRIPVVNVLLDVSSDQDGDGLSDLIEDSLGTDKNKRDTDGDGFSDGEEIESSHNPNGEGKMNIDIDFAERQKGKILLQVEKNGEAWYVHPDKAFRVFLGRPADAFYLNAGNGTWNYR